MDFELNNQLSECIETMDIPTNRRDTKLFGNVLWLSRNIRIRNNQHPEYENAIALIKQILRSKCYIAN